MPTYVTRRIIDALAEHRRGRHAEAKVLALGVTYKPDVGDLRESAAVETLAHLAGKGADVSYHDPFVPRLRSHGLSLRRTPLTRANIEAADLVVVLTPHTQYDLHDVLKHARLVFDARNALGVRTDDRVVTL